MRIFTRGGITLVETLVVIGVVSLLIGLIMPAIQMVRASADKLACQNNLRQLAMAVHHYHTDYKHIPKPAANFAMWQSDSTLLSNIAHLLPYLEQEETFTQGVQAATMGSRPWENPPHRGLVKILKVDICPSDSRLNSTLTDWDGIEAAYGSYLPCRGSGQRQGAGIFAALFPFRGISFSSVRDGLSNTIMLGERPPPDSLQAGKWYPSYGKPHGAYRNSKGPDDTMAMIEVGGADDSCAGGLFTYGPGRTENPCDRYHFWSLHPGGSNFAFGDTSVRWIPYAISRSVLYALATRSKGEIVELPD